MVAYEPVPPPIPEVPLVNLLAAARTPQGETSRWQHGTAYESLACPALFLRDPCDAAADLVVVRGDLDSAEGSEADEDRLVRAQTVYAETIYTCSALGWRETYLDRALAMLTAELPRAVEHELWTGELATQQTFADNRWLTKDGATDGTSVTDLTPGAGAVPPTEALAILEHALGQAYSGVGLIHVARIGSPFLQGTGLLTRNGKIVETLVGNRVVPGVGYPGTGPGGDAPDADTTWVYATPMVTVRLGAIELPDEAAVDAAFVEKGVNRLEIRPRAPFTVDWDGCAAAFAVQMSTTHE